MGQRYNKNAKTGDCGFQKVALEVSEVKLRKKKQAANCISFCKCIELQDRSMLPVRNQTSLMMSIPMRMLLRSSESGDGDARAKFCAGFHHTFD